MTLKFSKNHRKKSASFSCVKVRNVSSSRDAQVTAGDAAVAWLLSLKSALWAECRCPLSLSSLQGIKGLFLGAAAVAPHSVQFLLCTEEPVQRLDPCALSTPGTTTDGWTAGGIRVWAWIHHWCCVTNLTEQVVELQSWGLQVKDPRTDAAGAANVLHPNNNIIIIILNNCKPSLWTTMWMVITCLWK